jgi:hypothetical protein
MLQDVSYYSLALSVLFYDYNNVISSIRIGYVDQISHVLYENWIGGKKRPVDENDVIRDYNDRNNHF